MSASGEVPCGGCSACCRGPRRSLRLTRDEATDLITLERDGKTYLGERVDGTCVYLVDGRCSIYERRPRACRLFDCADLVPAHDPRDIPMHVRHAAAMRLTRSVDCGT